MAWSNVSNASRLMSSLAAATQALTDKRMTETAEAVKRAAAAAAHARTLRADTREEK